MRRLIAVFAVLVGGALAACSLSPTTPTQSAQTPYAVVYGRIGAPSIMANITVYFLLYTDSALALANGSSGYVAGSSTGVDSGNYFNAAVPAPKSGTYFLDVYATGQGQMGYVSSLDTIRALRTRFDTIGGSLGHDSVGVFDSLP